MILTDREIIKLLDIRPTDRILDIGGSMTQHQSIYIDTLVDIIRPEEAPYNPSKLLARRFVKVDITREKLPFKDKEYDIVLCTHVLEDLPTPFPIIEEMSRVAERGLIVTPSMGEDMKFKHIDYTDWLTGAVRMPGEAHHKWFFINKDGVLEIIPKVYPILYTKDFQIIDWKGDKEMVYVWEGRIKSEEFISLSIHKLIKRYRRFMYENGKYIKLGMVVIFLDNIFYLFKSWIKLLLKRGSGYKFY
jgi:hypothetical protein